MTDLGFENFYKIASSRRSNINIDSERNIDRATLERLCDLIQLAPNHRRTWPWRVAVFEGESRGRLGSCISDVMKENGVDAGRAEKARTKYLRAPAIIVVGAGSGANVLETIENKDAVAAGVQNLLLGATSLKMATLWSSCESLAMAAVNQICGFSEDVFISGIIYLGWPSREVPVPQRPPLDIKYFDLP
jgi:nitroreductase